MKKQITLILLGIVLVGLGIGAYVYGSKPMAPKVGEDGKIDGNYTIAGIMSLGKPYVCTFEKSDGASKIVGTIHTDGQNIYEEFRIRTDVVDKEFNSFLLVKGDETYTWTSLQNIGYKSRVAKSASKNASPQEQAQLIGTRDEVAYKCEPWLEADNSIFEIPTSVTFQELKK